MRLPPPNDGDRTHRLLLGILVAVALVAIAAMFQVGLAWLTGYWIAPWVYIVTATIWLAIAAACRWLSRRGS